MSSDLGIPYEPTFYVYALRDPATRKVGYVGVTNNPMHRNAVHWKDRLEGTGRKAAWLRKLVAKGKRPELLILEVTTAAARFVTEEKWIVRLAAEGHPLTNSVHVPRPDKPPQRVEPRGYNPVAGLLTPSEVAEEKQVSATTVVLAVREGRLPAWEKGGIYLIPLREVQKWQPVKGRGRRTPNPDA